MDPAPIGQHELIPIHTLVTPDFFKGEGITGAKVEALQGVFLARLQSYCSRETGESPLCALTGDVPDDRCVGGWLQQTLLSNGAVRLFNPVTGGVNCPTGYTWLTGQQRHGTNYRQLDFMPICVSLKASDCFLANGPLLGTSFGGYYTIVIDPTGPTVTCSTYSILIIQVDYTCKCPPGYHAYEVLRHNYLCLRSGGRDTGSTFGGGFDTSDLIGNGYILDPNILDNIGVVWTVFDCPIGYRVAPFFGPYSYICVLDSNKLLSNIHPVEIKFPNDTATSNTTAKPVNRTMNVHKLHTLQHTIEAHIDAAADEPFQMIQSLDDHDDSAANSSAPLEISSDDDIGVIETSSSTQNSSSDFDDDVDASYAKCLKDFELSQHLATARKCYRDNHKKCPKSVFDRDDTRTTHTITLGRNKYRLDEWGRVTGYTCNDKCTKRGDGRYGSHSGSMIKFLRKFYGAQSSRSDPDQAGHLLAPRLGIDESNKTAPEEVSNALSYNQDPLNFIPLIRSVNGRRGEFEAKRDNWGNGEEYAYRQIQNKCEVTIQVDLEYPTITQGTFQKEDYRPTVWTYYVGSRTPKGKLSIRTCSTKIYHGRN